MALKISIFLELVFYLPETWFLSIKHITYWHHHQHKFFAFMRAYFIVNAYLAGKIKYLFCKKFQKYLNNNSPKTPLKSKAELGQVETSSQKFWVSKKLHDENWLLWYSHNSRYISSVQPYGPWFFMTEVILEFLQYLMAESKLLLLWLCL